MRGAAPGSHGRRGLAAAAALAAWLLLPVAAWAQSETLESSLKATFLYRFGDFVQWPAATLPAGEPLNICIVGRDVFGGVLDEAAAGQQADGRSLAIYRLAAIDAATNCHIAYIAGSQAQSVEQALAAVAGAPILTVTDAARGAVRGMVHFEIVEDRVRFHIDEETASESGLGVSARLLGIALTVQRRTQ